MKKQITISLIALLLAGCSNDEQERQSEPDCSCSTIIEANVFSIPTNTWTVATIENNCTGAQRQIELNGRRVVGEKVCN